MRYLKRDSSLAVENEGAASQLLQQFGPYCAYCEDYLPAGFDLWNKKTDDVASTEFMPEVWSDMLHWHDILPLCRNCSWSTIGSDRPFVYPDEDQALFPWEGNGKVQYRLTDVRFELFDEDQPSKDSFDARVVLVEGKTDLVNSTIARFQLNSCYYVAGKMVMPHSAYNIQRDRRVERRTNAWRVATDCWQKVVDMGLIGGRMESNDEAADAVRTVVRNTFANTGFWSTWLSAFRAAALSDNINDMQVTEFARKVLVPLSGQSVSSDDFGEQR